MKLPDYERVIYEYNPLIEVIAQIRFPDILKITSQPPVDFQDIIRFEYPIFHTSTKLEIPIELSNIFTKISSNLTNDLSYQFRSEDSSWQLVLEKNSMTLITNKYERYEQFIDKFKQAVKTLEKIYNPLCYSRIGLRYRDLIIKSSLNILDKKWSELIPKHIASEFYTPEIDEAIINFMKNLYLQTEVGKINFNHGLVRVKDIEKNIDELAYLLDCDIFTEEKIDKGENIWNILERANRTARNIFRWSITEELHIAMKPQII